MNTINFWPILVASIIAFVIGAFWYSPLLFGKEWMTLVGISEKEANKMTFATTWKLYVGQFIATLVEFGVLAFILSVTNARSAADGAIIAFLIWLGFNATEGVGKLMWEKKPLKLILISSVAMLVSLVIGGVIMGAWK